MEIPKNLVDLMRNESFDLHQRHQLLAPFIRKALVESGHFERATERGEAYSAPKFSVQTIMHAGEPVISISRALSPAQAISLKIKEAKAHLAQAKSAVDSMMPSLNEHGLSLERVRDYHTAYSNAVHYRLVRHG
jgi:hypothetical protein